jgi:hypothetical protein
MLFFVAGCTGFIDPVRMSLLMRRKKVKIKGKVSSVRINYNKVGLNKRGISVPLAFVVLVF